MGMEVLDYLLLFTIIWLILAAIPFAFYLGFYRRRKKATKNIETHKLSFRGQIVNKYHYTEVIPGDDETPDTEVHYVKYTVQFWHNGKVYLAIKDYKFNKYDDQLNGVTIGVNPNNHDDVVILEIEERIAKGNKVINIVCKLMNIFMILATIALLAVSLLFII